MKGAQDRAIALSDASGFESITGKGVRGKAAGLLGVADPIKESTGDAIRALQRDGIRIVMLTGDSRTTAEAVAQKLVIDEVRAEVLPDQRLRKALQAQVKTVAMAGDGINDAPALAQAHVGIAMGTGAVTPNLAQHPAESLFAFVYNAAGVPIAAGALYLVWGLLLSPMIAAAAMSVSSVSVLTNALRLRRGEYI
ncbi:MAG TPA: HAD-IC family P-type ATPase [Polyangiaceae bacterium]|nr:HAD-IC family P-type ATPase [Polyangiaceae bacterium]